MRLEPERGAIRIGGFRATLQRMPVEGGRSLGAIGFHRVRDYAGRAPGEWPRDALFAPVPEGEALWLGFSGSARPEVRVQVGFGGLNAANGEPWGALPDESAGNFFLCPGQLWVEGVERPGGGPPLRFTAARKHYERLEIRLDGDDTQVIIYCVSPAVYHRVTGLDPPAPVHPEDIWDGSPLD